jgi:hypothetical protein
MDVEAELAGAAVEVARLRERIDTALPAIEKAIRHLERRKEAALERLPLIAWIGEAPDIDIWDLAQLLAGTLTDLAQFVMWIPLAKLSHKYITAPFAKDLFEGVLHWQRAALLGEQARIQAETLERRVQWIEREVASLQRAQVRGSSRRKDRVARAARGFQQAALEVDEKLRHTEWLLHQAKRPIQLFADNPAPDLLRALDEESDLAFERSHATFPERLRALLELHAPALDVERRTIERRHADSGVSVSRARLRPAR